MSEVAFVLLPRPALPGPEQVIRSARRGGVELWSVLSRNGMRTFEMAGGGSVVVALMPAPIPDVLRMPVGPLSPPPDQAAAAPAHLIVTALGMVGTARDRDRTLAIVTAAVAQPVDPVGVMLGHGAIFYRGDVFVDLVLTAASAGEPLPVEVTVDVTTAPESPTRMSFLTRTLQRYGREELFVTCPVRGQGALPFLYDLCRWLLTDSAPQLATGETVGRTAAEKIVVQRVPDPTGRGPLVVRLDLP
jgi:hypothetical protein